MPSRRIQAGQLFTIRIPRNANPEVIAYLSEYREKHTLGFGRHLFDLIRRGMEAEGLLDSHPNVRSRVVSPSETPLPSAQGIQSDGNGPLNSARTPHTDSEMNSTPSAFHIDLSNFE